MEAPSQPLTEQEEAELQQLLRASQSAPLAHARGVFSGLACEASLQEPTHWLELVLGSDVEDKAALKSVFSLLMRDRFAIAECLSLGQAFAPDPQDDEAVVQFCKGFVRVMHKSAQWQKDTDALALALPLAVLAGYLPLESLRKLQPETPMDAAEWSNEHRQRLPALLQEIYQHFAPLRQKQKAVASAGKVGRNEPCPCGSGKKYKKCCGN